MSIRAFIRENRAALEAAIRKACPGLERLSEGEIRLWILNDEALYNWARSEGVIL